ncbi:MAG: zf-HC2 domain-containing protein [Planctomycetes bacterium]|nr:zf-HC2 domain-containing protein [Planctomycetota bacterium]
MMAILDCNETAARFPPYAENTLAAGEKDAVNAHLRTCPHCQVALKRFNRLQDFARTALGPGVIPPEFGADTGRRLKQITSSRSPVMVEEEELEPVPVSGLDRFLTNAGGLPWWGISVAMHVLLIALLGLITMAIGQVNDNDTVVVVANLERAVQVRPEEPKSKDQIRDALASNHDTPATDPDSTVESNIVVPPDILAKAELGDHFETVNPDRPDTHSAFGNPDAHMFHSVTGNDEPEGGGGTEGVSLSDEMIGIGGSGSPGTGGGWGGGTGTGTGVGTGSGHGSFGARTGGGRKLMVLRHGGSKATEGAVDKALEWLARHQEVDGHWDCWKYEGRQEGRTQGINGDAAVTGFAVLAFLGAGHTEKVGKYHDNVKRGVYWLIKTMEENEKTCGEGRWCKNHGSNYTQGVASLALAEAAGMSRNAEWKAAAQKAINGVVSGQIKKGNSDYEGWDYAPGGTTNDTSVTGWNVMALKSAKVAGIKVDPASLMGAMNWINSGQDLKGAPKDGDADYWEGGMMTYRGQVGAPPNPKNMAMTAAAALTRLFIGGEKPTSPGVAGPCNLMKKEANLPTEDKARFNLYYWYYGTLVMFQKGGDYWKLWNESMRKSIPNAQRKDGDFDGSWDPYFTEGTGYIYGGRVMSTSLGALVLEVYYRYLPLYR